MSHHALPFLKSSRILLHCFMAQSIAKVKAEVFDFSFLCGKICVCFLFILLLSDTSEALFSLFFVQPQLLPFI
jgi:hypothetical protein